MEQVLVVAVAAYVTYELTVSEFEGLLTATVAKARAAKNKESNIAGEIVFKNLPQRGI